MERLDKVDMTRAETGRYSNLPKPLKGLFLASTCTGIGVGVFYLSGSTIGGETLFDFSYFYLMTALFLPLAFLIQPARKKAKGIPWYDLLLAAVAFAIPFYLSFYGRDLRILGWMPITASRFILALTLCLLVLEGARRVAGPIYVAVCIIVGLYPVVADKLPGVLYGRSFSFPDTVGMLIFSSEGLLGVPSSVLWMTLIAYLFFAGVMISSGAGDFFVRVSLALFGRFRGGAAKTSVLSSGLFGTLSGSGAANVVATGTFTIPAMKRAGFAPHYAAAVEACASTGGLIMPPIMAAVAFVMAVILGVEYTVVVVAAALPAILYYFGLMMQVDAYAANNGLKGLPRELIPSLKETLKEGWPFIIVLVFLVFTMVYMRWTVMAPFYATGLMFALSFTNRKNMMTPRRITEALVEVGKLVAQVVAIILPIGLITAGATITGSTAAFAGGFALLGGGNVILLLLIAWVISFILGLGGLLLPGYLFLAATLAPVAVKVGGLDPVAVHLFLLYCGITGGITPPVAVAAFVAAGLAGSRPMQTGFTAMRLGAVIFFIPFFFVFDPALILRGPFLRTLYLFPLSVVGVWLVAAGLEGYLLKLGKVEPWLRPLLFVAGLLIGFPEWKTTVIGVALVLLGVAIALTKRKMAAARLITANE